MSVSSDDSCGAGTIGYVEKCEDQWKLESRFFPSKVGGYPAWLDLKNIPGVEELKCQKCGNPSIFLCQVYAPIEEHETCFHRTIFIFLCLDPGCCEINSNTNFRVLRCQLPRKNDCYTYQPPVYEEDWCKEIQASKYVKLCFVCGCGSKNHCAKCKKINYCGRKHQVVDWKAGHKARCGKGSDAIVANSKLLLPEYELLTENEECYSESCETSDSEVENGEKADTDIQNIKATFQGDREVDEDLLRMARYEQPSDQTFQFFRKHTRQHPHQVLRYERGGEPLWITDIGNSPNVPACPICGAARQFEFQILPQLLNYLKLDQCGQSIDWGTLAIYTCTESCDAGPPYKTEFLWKQDLPQ